MSVDPGLEVQGEQGKPARFRVHQWIGEFIDPGMENDYRDHKCLEMARQLRITLMVWMVMFVLFILPDHMGMEDRTGFAIVTGYRLAFVGCLLIGYLKLRKNPRLAPDGWLAMTLALIGYPFFFLYFVYRPDVTVWNLGVMMLLQLSVFLYLPGRVVLGLVVVVFGLLGTLVTMAMLGKPMVTLVGVVFILGLPALVGYFTALRFDRMLRNEFALRLQVFEANNDLLEEIERRKALEAELERQATTDPLTGLCNRRQYEMLFSRERNRANRQQAILSVALLDLDHFKRINDDYGHDVGDQALVHVAEVLRESLRNSDVIGRFGGEEFVVLLPDTPLERAHAVMLRVAEALRATPLPSASGPLKITATIAVTVVKEADNSLGDTLKRVDVGLYEGKRAGRDRVVVT